MAATAEDLPVGKLLPYRSPQSHQEWTAVMGMVIFLASWIMLFAALFFVYAGVRARAAVWPPLDLPALPAGRGLLNTLVIAVSSGVFHYGLRSVQRGRAAVLPWALLVALLLGTLFLVLQADSWLDLYGRGLLPSSGTYGSVFYGLTWLHALHVFVGLVALGVLAVRAFAGRFHPARHVALRLWGMYWHFVGVVWLVVFVTVYLA